MKKEFTYPKIFFVLNLLMAFVMFLNIIIVKKKIDMHLFILIISYFFLVIINRILNSLLFDVDEILNLIINIFILISIVILYRISNNVALKQMIFIIIGYFIYFLFMFFVKDISVFYKFKWIYFILTFFLMSLSFLFGKYVNGSKNWISLFGITFQPSEFGKIFLIFYISSVLRDNRSKKDKYVSMFLLLCIILFLVLQKDLGTALIVFLVSMLMYYMKTFKYKFLLFSFISTLIGGIVAYNKFSHVRVRISAWLNPERDPNGASYQVLQGFFSMGSGGILGRGLYKGNLEFIPVNYTDYIFVSIVEEFGIIMGILIVTLYFLFFIRVFRRSVLIKKNFESVLLILGLIVLISFQAILILGGILNLIPLTGVTLPFISYGGSSIISMFIMFAIIQKVLEGIKVYD